MVDETVRDECNLVKKLVRCGRSGDRTAMRSVLAVVLSAAVVGGCTGKNRAFGDAVPGEEGTEGSVNSEGGLPGVTPTTSGMGGLDDEAQRLPPLDEEGLPAVEEVLPGDAVGGQAGPSCDDDAGSCAPTADPGSGSACIPTGPRDCTSDLDNDCDGQPDNVLDDVCVCLPDSVEPCEDHPGLDGRGQCRAGTRTCILSEGSQSSDWGACEGSVGPGERDSCSVAGDDTDCDGIDNGGCPCIEGETRPCGPDTEDGICQRGTQTCVNGTFGQCVGAVFPAPRNCASNQDNDCDGRADNVVDNVCTCTVGAVQACGTHPGRDGNGQCQAGSQRCESRASNTTSTFGTCSGSVGPALQDTCADGNDGNCNGVPNEGCACVNGQTRGCGPDTDVGLCQRGTQTCVNGAFGACQGAVFPAPRNCASAQDNDCDGRPDNTLDDVCTCPEGEVLIEGQCLPNRPRTLVAGGARTCVIFLNGRLRCWGDGVSGALGYGNNSTIGDNEVPAAAGFVDVGGPVDQVALGTNHTCALLQDGTVRCWGNGTGGVLGQGNTQSVSTPRSVPPVSLGGRAVELAAGRQHTCARLDSGNVVCWGSGSNGVLGYGNTQNIGDNETPASAGAVNLGGTVAQIAAGGSFNCARLTTGSVRCWGIGTFGSLGYANVDAVGDDEPPVSAGLVNVGGTVSQLATGDLHTCALLSSGDVVCWGTGVLGYGNRIEIGDDEVPATAGRLSLGGSASRLTAGGGHTCVIIEDGGVRCWGNNQFGQLGLAHTTDIGDNELPSSVPLVDVGEPATQIAAGLFHTCALVENNRVHCWGRGTAGELGYGTAENVGDDESPVEIGGVPFF